MSHRPHPLRQAYTVDYSIDRQPSTTSSASSGYSHSSGGLDLSRTTTLSSSDSTGYGSMGHKRGKSEATPRLPPSPKSPDSRPQTSAGNVYSMARQSLRPLPQPPNTTPAPPARDSPYRHDRGQSIDIGKLSLHHDKEPPSPTSKPRARASTTRPTSMVLTRSDGFLGGSAGLPPPHVPLHQPHAAQLARPDLVSLGRSSTSQLRTLSKLAQSGEADEFAIIPPAQQVVGLRGRRRLQKGPGMNPVGQRSSGYGWEGRNWMDKQRQFLQAYEYLCHIGEAKEWIEDIMQKPIPPIVELEEALRDGVTLAEIVESLNPTKRYKIFHHPRLQYRHSDNIAIFFRYLDEVELPDLFRFELIDLYEKKNIPKVIYCIHALSWLLFRKGIVSFRIGNLVGQLEFEHHELEAMQKGLDKLGVNMPSFGTMGADFGEPEPEPEPEETEEERIDRELAENEDTILELQAQMRGAMCRMKLGDLMQHLWNSEEWLIDLQSRIRGDWTRQVVNYRLQMRHFAVSLQSAARGFLVRRKQVQKDRFWKSTEGDILDLQSMIRAAKVRREVRDVHSQLSRVSGPVRGIQAAFMGYLARQNIRQQKQETARVAGPISGFQAALRGTLLRNRLGEDQQLLAGQAQAITGLQAAIRGALLRNSTDKDQKLLARRTKAITGVQAAVRGALLRKKLEGDQQFLAGQALTITGLQAAARAMLTRKQAAVQRESLQRYMPAWDSLQAACRGRSARMTIDQTKAYLKQHTPELEVLQSCIRAAAVRRDVSTLLEDLAAHEPDVVDLQSNIRGMLERQRLAKDRQALAKQAPKITRFQACIRGDLFRAKHLALLEDLEANEEEVVGLQALARAMMLRENVGFLIGALEEEEESVVAVQAAAQAFIVRARFEEKKRYFRENMERVVKIQSFVRGKLQGEAYKSLTTGKNPPVGAVKNFVHLLNDSDFDFNEEVEFERMRKTVVQQVRQNEMLEQYIDQLDIKIALLVKNKITLDEVVRHQHNYGGHAGTLLANSSIITANQFDLKALNKSSRKKLDLYQQLFFSLQTQPQYLARLFKRIREQGTAEKECKRIEHLMMGLFGYAQKRREEYYLLKLVARAVKEEIEACNGVQDYVRGNFFWSKLLSNYTRSPRDRKYWRDLLGPIIRDNIIEDPALDLESDPMQIYRSAISNEELRTGQPSRRPLDIPRELAIKDTETRELFIDHLRDLREICDQFFLALEDLIPRLPYGLRYLCQQMFQFLCQHFQREPQQNLLQMVANWFWRFYLYHALTSPENVGVIEKQLSPLQKRNLGEVAKVLGQVASGRHFGGENIYLQPLNAFIGDSIERMNHIMRAIISVPDAESTFDIDEYNDLYAKNRPTLYIKMADIFAIHNLVAAELPFICPNRDDVLREIMQDLGSAKNNESEMTATGSSDIQMFLTPKLHDVEDPEAEIKTLFMETKRCVLYIIRVQSGANLLEILVKPITPEDELKWETVLREDFSGNDNTRGAYSDANMVDVTSMTYYELKKSALQNVMALEKMGRITKHNFYQDVLNAIALDIRTKSRRRVQRQRELEGVRLTLGNLHEKAKYLEQQRKSYDDYIEQAMSTLQKNKGKKKFLLPFTRQYNHQRELERSGRVPKFGSYKYSARQLMDKGVLVRWTGTADRDWDKINLTISCDQVGVFAIEGSRGHIQIPGANALVPIEDLLQAQFESQQFITLFEGNLRLNVNLLLHLLYKKFYKTQ
ncbi:Ras GTPase-activating-like protein rng2 [Cytospora mali]|uniref:Ras GTPase-activating-like protein rng2 n=1 Tax=Cytospora mali TaxID=578113 RepID=A0A194W4B0_CYTMA|nr:Ras GTPase-activating-like protein rng2 [Valsa mali]